VASAAAKNVTVSSAPGFKAIPSFARLLAPVVNTLLVVEP